MTQQPLIPRLGLYLHSANYEKRSKIQAAFSYATNKSAITSFFPLKYVIDKASLTDIGQLVPLQMLKNRDFCYVDPLVSSAAVVYPSNDNMASVVSKSHAIS